MADLVSGASGAVGGAAAGAAAGSIIPGVGTAVGAILGGAAGLFKGLFGGGSNDSAGRYKFTPEQEIQYIQSFQNQLTEISTAKQQLTQLSQVYNDRLDLIEQVQRGMMPDTQAYQQLIQQNHQIASAFGGDVQKAIDAGFMDESSAKEIQRLQQLSGPGATDPALEGQLRQQKDSLEQDLARSGVGPAQRAIAMKQFDQTANEQRYAYAQSQSQLGLARIQAGLNVRAQNYNIAMGEFGAGQQQAGYEAAQVQQGLSMQDQLAAQRLVAGQQELSFGQQLRGEEQGAFAQLGKTAITKTGQRLYQTGLIGPGSVYQQTGVSKQTLIPYSKFQLGAETQASRYGTPLPDTSLPAFQKQQYAQYVSQQNQKQQALTKLQQPSGGFTGLFGGNQGLLRGFLNAYQQGQQ